MLEYLVRTAVRPVDGQWQPAEPSPISAWVRGWRLMRMGTRSRCGEACPASRRRYAPLGRSVSGIQAAIRPAGGSWLAPQTAATRGGGEPQIASDASGDVIIVASRQAPERSTGIWAVLRPSGDTFLPVQKISRSGNDFNPREAMNARGDALVAWERNAARGCLVEAAFRPANGHWSKPRVLPDAHVGCPADQQDRLALIAVPLIA